MFIFHKENLEIRRQFFHLIFGLFLSFLISINKFNVIFFTFVLFISLILSYVVKNGNIFLISFLLKHFERPNDAKHFPGKGFITFLVGAISSYLLFGVYFDNLEIAVIALLSLTIGDSFSSLYGNSFGKIKNPFNKKKSVEGPVFAFIFLVFILNLFLPFFQTVIISLVVVFIEVIDIKIFKFELDDNIYIPLIAGSLVLILNYLL